MMTRVIPALAAGEIPAAAGEAAALLRSGGIVGLPTETVYGLACDALNAEAATAVFAAKERPSFDPLIVHVAGADWIGALSSVGGRAEILARKLAEAFWPGPLTLVLASKDLVPDLVRSGLPTVALRCSAHPVMAEVIGKLARPLAAPSANRFGRISPVTAQHVVEELGGRIPLVLDGGPCRHGLESTIVEVGEGELVLLRPGPVTIERLEEFAPVRMAAPATSPNAPGMLESHYAPRTPLRIIADDFVPADAAGCGLLAFGAAGPGFAAVEILPGDPDAAAPLFFAALRRLDSRGFGRIYAREISQSGLGRAIMDRLRKAAHE